MVKSYFLHALRQMLLNKGYSTINISGLTIGISCSLIIALYVYDELRYDKFHTDVEHIYRINYQTNLQREGVNTALTPAGLAPLVVTIPDVKSAVRLAAWKTFPIRYQDKTFTEKYLLLADANFFDFFSFELVIGDPSTVLKGERKIVLSESAARKYFNYRGPEDESPVGKTLSLAQGYEVQVSGIAKDPPTYSHIHFTHILSIDSWDELPTSSWLNPRVHTYLTLKPEVLIQATKDAIRMRLFSRINDELSATHAESFEEFTAAGNTLNIQLQPLTSIHLGSGVADEIEEPGSRQYVYLYMSISILIALLACINFINLSTALSVSRAKEVGVRKAAGATVDSLVKQFLAESYLYVLISLIFAYYVIAGLLPIFNYITSKEIPYSILFTWPVMLSVVGGIAVIGLLAGSYPAFYLTRFSPVEVLRGRLRETLRKFGMRNVLVVFQFFISSSLILATLVVYDQLDFMQNFNMGFNKGNILNLLHTKNLQEKAALFKEELLQYDGVVRASYANRLPPELDWTSTFRPAGSGKDHTIAVYEMDFDHLETMEYTMVQGRFFSREFLSDSSAIIINETAMKMFGWTDITNKTIYSGYDTPVGRNRQVIGVIKDFTFRSARDPVLPMIAVLAPVPGWEMAVRVKEGWIDSTKAHIEQLWNRHVPNSPFEVRLIEQNLVNAYKTERRTAITFLFFTALAIVIAGLGLYGLASFMGAQRTKEIGIRKVVGGTVTSITFLLNERFLTLVFIGNLLSYPAVGWYMSGWLRQFDNHVSLSVSYFLITTVICVLIAILSTTYRVVKAASQSPVKSLRSE